MDKIRYVESDTRRSSTVIIFEQTPIFTRFENFASYLPVTCLWLDMSVCIKCTFFSPQDFSMPSAIRLPVSTSISNIIIFCNKYAWKINLNSEKYNKYNSAETISILCKYYRTAILLMPFCGFKVKKR